MGRFAPRCWSFTSRLLLLSLLQHYLPRHIKFNGNTCYVNASWNYNSPEEYATSHFILKNPNQLWLSRFFLNKLLVSFSRYQYSHGSVTIQLVWWSPISQLAIGHLANYRLTELNLRNLRRTGSQNFSHSTFRSSDLDGVISANTNNFDGVFGVRESSQSYKPSISTVSLNLDRVPHRKLRGSRQRWMRPAPPLRFGYRYSPPNQKGDGWWVVGGGSEGCGGARYAVGVVRRRGGVPTRPPGIRWWATRSVSSRVSLDRKRYERRSLGLFN